MKALSNTALFCIAVFAFAYGLCNATEASDFFGGWLVGMGMTPNQPLPIFYHAAVTFEQGAFKLKEKPLNEFSSSQLEVVGHITEEQS